MNLTKRVIGVSAALLTTGGLLGCVPKNIIDNLPNGGGIPSADGVTRQAVNEGVAYGKAELQKRQNLHTDGVTGLTFDKTTGLIVAPENGPDSCHASNIGRAKMGDLLRERKDIEYKKEVSTSLIEKGKLTFSYGRNATERQVAMNSYESDTQGCVNFNASIEQGQNKLSCAFQNGDVYTQKGLVPASTAACFDKASSTAKNYASRFDEIHGGEYTETYGKYFRNPGSLPTLQR